MLDSTAAVSDVEREPVSRTNGAKQSRRYYSSFSPISATSIDEASASAIEILAPFGTFAGILDEFLALAASRVQ